MTRTRTIRIRALTLAIAATFAFSAQIASAKTNPQGLWVGGYKYFSEFQGNALLNSGTPKARLAFGSQVYNGPFSIAFDGHGNLWAVFQSINNNLPPPALEITKGDLAALASHKSAKAKLITINGNPTDQFVIPVSIDFDAEGNLWVIDDGRRVVELLANELKKTSTQSAAVSIASQVASPTKLRFDRSDNLWVVEFPLPFDPSHPMICRFTPSDRAVSGFNPSLIVNLPDVTIPVVDFAFDSAGNLWVAGPGPHGDEIAMVSASDLSGSGEISPSAAVTINSAAFGLLDGTGSCIGGIDFDHSGNLWASVGADNADCSSDTQLVQFTPSQLSTGGNLTPTVIIGQNASRTNLFVPGPLRFGPNVP
ncbi:MAG TPA: hypothetical protein VIW95_05260 [Candidatus Binatus sp.]|uniref:hypothetical protein n=1 Tax=Candidatus Binatus sp. TaxID=2811406 RepID=UPI002F4260E5